ncbi:PREDICTED: facilitated trehalose transporter Tret1-2 homolog [Nicrophorus vespilloides]|uniref:Facilitated trehalose transporter Tret1-2 homolog n=1 Tax=Nicrophorus vespilloides TaxID=110193 RepID=A0ABM1MAP9_NICVS|nr:PREDICTED: facilitated trehalose transporter Tret1-2 homolog [Nicrophorus vespilloides]
MGTTKNGPKVQSKQWPQYVAVLSATVISIAAGVNIAWPSPSIPRLVNGEFPYAVSKEEGSYIAIITCLGNIVGGPIAASLVDIIGRKLTIILIAIPQCLSFIMISVSRYSVCLLYLARFMGGMGEGSTLTVMAMYIGEIAEPQVRGTLGSYISLTLRIGMLFINVIGSYFTIEMSSLICLVLPVLFLSTFVFMPETPYYLLMKGNVYAARRSLRFLRRKYNIEEELRTISNDVNRQLSESGRFRDLYTIPSNRRACLIILGLRTFQQFSGISAFTLYTQQLFKEAVENMSPSVAANIFSGLQLLLTFFSSILVDILGRKPLLIFSCVSCFFILIIEAVYFTLRDFTEINVDVVWWIPLTGMIIYIIVFSVGLGSIVNLMLGELFSQSVKAKALCLMNIYFALAMSATTKFFQFMTDLNGLSIPIFVFGSCCGLGALFCYYFVPETKGKTLEEIQQCLKGKKS